MGKLAYIQMLDGIKTKHDMGTWGTAIFSDDFASDIRSEFKDKIAFGKSPSDATDELISDYKDSLADEDDASVFWLSLSAVQWQTGRLQEKVKKKALKIIDSGQDLNRFKDDKKQQLKRKDVLEKLKTQLEGSQPTPKKIPVPFIRETKMEKGNLICYKHSSGNIAIFKVIDINQDHCGDRYPKVELFDFFDSALPDLKEIKVLKPLKPEETPNDIFQSSGLFYLTPYGKKDSEPWEFLEILDKRTMIETDVKGTVSLIWWKDFDDFLLKSFKN